MTAPMTIRCETIETLVLICTKLTEQGHGYHAVWSDRHACWIITMTGAF